MKKLLFSAAVALMTPLMSIGQSTLGPGVISSSLSVAGMPHNFSGYSWNTYNAVTHQGQQICQPCHTPHNADITITSAPLWNHRFTTASYQMYTGYEFGLGGNGYGITAPDGTSRLCLSCHDGTVALGAYGQQTGTTYMVGGGLLGTDLRNDHPVSFPYDSFAAGGMHAPNYPTRDYTGVPTGNTVADMLDGDSKVQCTSCHDQHDNSNGYMLVMDNRNSALCLSCHRK